MEGNIEKSVDFFELKWDTDYFGITSAKAILNKPLTLNKWEELKCKFNEYQFISIVNNNSEPVNAQLIGKDTSAFLADVNIQFMKKIINTNEPQNNITFYCALKRNNEVIELADFQFSKFKEDPELAKRGGDKLYRQWLINSFDDPDKFFALSKDTNGRVNGLLLYSYSEEACLIELIAVSKEKTKSGVGTTLFKAIEYEAYLRGFNTIKVGTQLRNLDAINFYHKVGCKQIGCHQVYHLWNL